MQDHLRRVFYFFFIFTGQLVVSSMCLASVAGVYGVKNNAPELSKYNIGAVFLPPDNAIIGPQVAAGRDVYLSFNVFGGSGAWKLFADSIPVQADGNQLGGNYGGVCPTHSGWRQSRLQVLTEWVQSLGGASGISGIWLDFIRYPGRWEHAHPDIPDTCYCERCLRVFQSESGVVIPDHLEQIKDKAGWIKSTVPLQWMEWKKKQITSFVREARQILDENSKGRKLQLGVYLVPWRKSDFEGAVSFQLAQDVEELSPYVDVFSPMVYHRMVGKPAGWLGEITNYLEGLTDKPVWPIIQSEEVAGGEFGEVLDVVGNSAAKGLLVYSMRHMTDEQWPQLHRFKLRENLFPAAESIEVDLSAGSDSRSRWETGLPACAPDTQYLFSADFYRPDRNDSLAYPEVTIWGQDYLLNTHRLFGKYQKLKAIVSCPADGKQLQNTFVFRGSFPGTPFSMKKPQLVAVRGEQIAPNPVALNSFYPIGTYGANASNLEEIKELGLNSAVVGMSLENIEKCLELGMRCTLSVTRDPEKLILALDKYDALLRQGNFLYYVNDEPGIHSFSEGKAEDIQRILKQRFPDAMTNMAIVRPQAIAFYQKAADYFMLDQYPVPNMPMSWLSDSMDEAAEHVGRSRLQAVIQAFGGEKFAGSGWPRLPSFEEMNNLAFLSIIHGSRGIYFFTYPSISGTEQGRKDFSKLIRGLHGVRSWLVLENDTEPVAVTMLYRYGLDPAGKPGVHCATKEQYGTKMLICANTLRNLTVAGVTIPENRKREWRDYFGDGRYHADGGGQLRLDFKPLEVKVLMEVSQ